MDKDDVPKSLPDHMVREYQKLYLKHYNTHISYERAQEEGLALTNLLYIITKYNKEGGKEGPGAPGDRD
ncbi:MAG: hypothetical protein KDD43_09810 [Bdellovibrionales bacterium]|nr:hypothetical protein [Bdellovibrionales bacterium]